MTKRTPVLGDVARFLTSRPGQMIHVRDIAAETGHKYNSVAGAAVRLTQKPGVGIVSHGGAIFSFRSGLQAPPVPQVTPVSKKVYEGLGTTKSGRIIVRDPDTDDIYFLSEEL